MNEMDYNQFDSFVEDLLGEKNDRPIVIIGASRIDDLLFRILQSYLLPKNNKPKIQDELLEGDKPIGTFSSRIKLVYRLGIIDISLYQILERIRAIRNKSAHSIIFSIEKSPIREHTNELRKLILKRKSYIKTYERYYKREETTRTRELQCIMITICVLLEAINETITQTKGINSTLVISKR